jgi:L-arabinose transport system permease protein
MELGTSSQHPIDYQPASTSARRIGAFLEQLGMLVILAVLFICCSIFVDNFFTAQNLKGLLLAVSTVGMVSCTMLFCLASGNFDLSVGTLVPCAGVIAALVTSRTGSYSLGLSSGLIVGVIVGFLNGFIVAVCRINPLITTLAMMQIVKTVTFKVSEGKAIGVANPAFFFLGQSSNFGIAVPMWLTRLLQAWFGSAAANWLYIPTPIWLCFGCFLWFGFLLDRTTFGRNTLAIGGNEEAARLAGISVTRTKIIIFAMQGLIAAFAGIVLAGRMASGQPKSSEGFELEVIAACVLGGVSLTGGIGRISFVIAGVLIMGIVQDAMSLLNVESFWQYGVRGSILLAAVLFDRLKHRR